MLGLVDVSALDFPIGQGQVQIYVRRWAEWICRPVDLLC